MSDSVSKAVNNNIVATGFISIMLVLAISAALIMVFTTLFGTEFFLNWVGTFFMCATPFQIMMAVVWEHQQPSFLAKLEQPVKGLSITLLFILVGAIVIAVLFYTVGGGVMSPILIHYTIQSVGVSLLVIIVFGCWPINIFIKKPFWLGICTLMYCYVLNFILFKVFYNYSFFSELPFYASAFDPSGLFNGITALSYAVTAVATVMVLIMFEMWPVPVLVRTASQPMFGLVATAYILLLAAIVYYIGVPFLNMEPMDYMVKVPVCIIFGAFLVDNMMQFQLFSQLQQPIKGIIKTLICAFSAFVMYLLYSALLPFFVGSELPAGPANGYVREAWIGTAMLGITFPVINFVSGAFEFWPILRKKKL